MQLQLRILSEDLVRPTPAGQCYLVITPVQLRILSEDLVRPAHTTPPSDPPIICLSVCLSLRLTPAAAASNRHIQPPPQSPRPPLRPL